MTPFPDGRLAELVDREEHTEHLEHRAARGGRRAEALLMQKQINALGMQVR
jgi:hypothetical protein